MRLVLPLPDDWPVVNDDDGWLRAVVPGYDGIPDLVVAVSPVRTAPPVFDAGLFASELGAGLPSNARIHLDACSEERGECGWPVTVVRGVAVGSDGSTLEWRVAAIYRLLDRVASVVVVGSSSRRWEEEVAALCQIALAGDLDWSGPPASLASILGVTPE